MKSLLNNKKPPHYLGHRRRLKEKYRESRLNGLLDHEVLEFALTFALPRKDTKPIAKELLSRFKTISGVLEADLGALQQIEGISEHSALFIQFLKDISIQYSKKDLYNKDLINSPEAVYDYLRVSLKGECDEEFRALFLNNRNFLQAEEVIHKGTINKTVVYPRKIAELALHNHSAGVIIAHNHPGGSLEPSKEDILVTETVRNALKTVDVDLLDHVIIGGSGYFSFKENNIVEVL